MQFIQKGILIRFITIMLDGLNALGRHGAACVACKGRARAFFHHSCQMAIARFLDRMCMALRASGLRLRYAMLQNLIPSFPWIAPGWRAWGRNPRKGRQQILQSSIAEP